MTVAAARAAAGGALVRAARVGALAVTLTAPVACGAAGSAEAAVTHVVEIRGFAFHPATLRVSAGDTIVWRNMDVVPHTATGTGARIDTGDIPAGEARTAVVRFAGREDYICAYHPAMTGTLEVR